MLALHGARGKYLVEAARGGSQRARVPNSGTSLPQCEVFEPSKVRLRPSDESSALYSLTATVCPLQLALCTTPEVPSPTFSPSERSA